MVVCENKILSWYFWYFWRFCYGARIEIGRYIKAQRRRKTKGGAYCKERADSNHYVPQYF